jgi:2-C-methyl-D-erythritol 4-phosphate cytidylyltransferase
MITKVVRNAIIYGAASASTVVVDTVKRVDKDGFAVGTENREELRLATTPQIFDYELYGKAVSLALEKKINVTDDNMLMEYMGVRVHMTDVGKTNIKITYAEDVAFAEYILERRDG